MADQTNNAHDLLTLPNAGDDVNFKGANVKAQNQSHRRSSNSSVKGNSAAWRLKYRDFLPSPSDASNTNAWDKSDPFHKLVDRANDWLKKSPEVRVSSCETVTWVSHDQSLLGDSELMMLTKSVKEKTLTYYVRGLRLWLIPNLSQKACHLSFSDVIPENSDELPDLISKANKKLQNKNQKGYLVTVETVGIPVIKSGWNSSVTKWSERVEEDSASIFILRMFYVREVTHLQRRVSITAVSVKLGLKDVVPLMQPDDTYEDYETLVDKANVWMKENSINIQRVVTMQSVMVQKHSGPQDEIGNNCHFIMPGINNPALVEFFRILRVIFVESNEPQTPKNPKRTSRSEKQGLLASSGNSSVPQNQPALSPLTFVFETFTPELVWSKAGFQQPSSNAQATDGEVKVERMEKMKELYSKVMAYLRNTGSEVLAVETVFNPMQVYVDDSSIKHLYTDEEIKFLFTIRLYLAPHASENRSIRRASFQPPSNQQQGGGESDGGELKMGNESRPLFLRNVVGRQYKYRWLVLALSAFSCMAIIVVVSVVYSNR